MRIERGQAGLGPIEQGRATNEATSTHRAVVLQDVQHRLELREDEHARATLLEAGQQLVQQLELGCVMSEEEGAR